MPPLAGSCPYSGSPEEPPFSSLNAELADISAADDTERRGAKLSHVTLYAVLLKRTGPGARACVGEHHYARPCS